ncbi:MAG TPA: hypothetical protein VI452_10335 [Marmoricola sp.]
MPARRAWLSWSSGKDSTLALATAREDPGLEVVGLLTTINADAQRVAMHAVRRSLLAAQADALGLPLHVVELPWPCSNEEYERRMAAAVRAARGDGVTRMVFGDLFLADVRAYREQALAGTGLAPVFPLWGRDTAELAAEMVDRGVRATLTCVDPRQLDAGFAGRAYDADLLADLPPGVDPCGEYGEFHTFVHDGPGFARPLAVRTGEVVARDGFVFADVLPVPDLPVPDAG